MSHSFRLSCRNFAAGLLAGTTLAGFAAPVQAQSNDTFTGAQSSDWYDGANWSANQPPAVSDSASITDTTAAIDGGQVEISSARIADNNDAYVSMSNAAQVGFDTLILGGSNGTGYLSINTGARLTSANTMIGSNQFGATGHVTLTGAGSLWDAGNFDLESGAVEIADQAELLTGGAGTEDDINGPSSLIALSSGASWISRATHTIIGDYYGNLQPSQARITVFSGASVSLENAVLGLHGGTGMLTNAGGSTVVSGDLIVGGSLPYQSAGNGQIGLSQGASLITGSGNNAAVVGSAGGNGVVTLADPGTTWKQNGKLGIGLDGGTGTVELTYGARVYSGAITIGEGENSQGLFWINQGASAVTGSATIGSDGGSGTVRLTDVANWQVAGTLNVGGGIVVDANGNFAPLGAGTGQVIVKGGSSLTAGFTAIGAGSGAQGGLDLVGTDNAGNGAVFTSSGATFIGAFGGAGKASADDGASFKSSQLIVGYDAGNGLLSSDGGTIAITRDAAIGSYRYQDGPTSGALMLTNRASFTAGDYVYVGAQGSGTVSADGNATLETGAATFGLSGGAADISLVNQSQWRVHGSVQIGGQFSSSGGAATLSTGKATVTLDRSQLYSDGAASQSLNAVGIGAGSSGSVGLTGQGSLLHMDGQIAIGALGATGVVSASNHASVEFMNSAYIGLGSSDYVGAGSRSSGSINLDNANGSAKTAYIAVDSGSGGATLGGLSLSNGSRWTGDAMLVGIGAGAIGHVTVDRSTIDLTRGLIVGSENGNGVFLVTSGDVDLGSGDLAIGCSTNCMQDGAQEAGSGTVGLSGGSTLATQGDLVVGGYGAVGTSGQLNAIDNGTSIVVGGSVGVLDGGSVSLSLGATADVGAPNKVMLIAQGGSLVADSGAQLTVHGLLGIDGSAHVTASGVIVDQALVASGGTLTIDGGSQVSSDYVAIYDEGAHQGLITVSGEGSRLTSAGAIDLGGYDYQGLNGFVGGGQLAIGAGAELDAGGAINVATMGGTATLTVHANPHQNLNTVKVRAGSLDVGAGGVYHVGIDTASASAGVVSVVHGVTLADGSTIDVFKENGGQYQLGRRYVILLTDLGRINLGDVKLTGDTRRSLFIGLVPEVAASPVSDFGQALYLDVKQDKTFASVAKTPNEIATATAADILPNANALKTAMLYIQTEDEAHHSYNLVSGEIHASLRSMLFDDARLPREAVLDRLSSRAGQTRRGLWLQALANWGTIGADGNAALADHNSQGLLGGIDADLGDATLGLAGGYTDTRLNVDARASHATARSWHLLGYAGASIGPVRLRAGLGYAHADINARRSVAFTGYSDDLRSDYSGSTMQGFGEVGYSIPVRNGTIEPYAGVAVVHSHSDAFREIGGAAALNSQAASNTVTASSLGLHAATAGQGPIFASATIGWQHRFGDLKPASIMQLVGSQRFSIAGAPISSNAAALALTAGWRITPASALSVTYSGQIGERSNTSAVRLTLSLGF